MSGFPEVLAQGFKRFHESFYREDTQLMHDLVTQGQQPHTCVVACCDSRVDPAHLFNSKPGDLFVIRAIANHIPKHADGTIGAGVVAGLYYAVMVLKVKHVVIMGHSQCGGVRAVMENDDLSALPPELSSWLKDFVSIQSCCESDDHEARIVEGEKACCLQSFEALKSYDFIDDAKSEFGLTVHACYFDMKSGVLATYNEKNGQFEH